MYYRKIKDKEIFQKKYDRLHSYFCTHYFDENLGYWRCFKKDSKEEKYWKNYSNRIIRRNKNDYYLTKSNNYRKEFDYWCQLW